MADSKKNVFFIGGYSYTVDKSTPLCRREDFFHSATLYQSPNGRFFVVENDAADTITVKVLSKSDAKTFMDEHPAGIFTENYIRIFGQPKQGSSIVYQECTKSTPISADRKGLLP